MAQARPPSWKRSRDCYLSMQVVFSGNVLRCANIAGATSSFTCPMECDHGMVSTSSMSWNFLHPRLACERENLTKQHDRSACKQFWASMSAHCQKATCVD